MHGSLHTWKLAMTNVVLILTNLCEVKRFTRHYHMQTHYDALSTIVRLPSFPLKFMYNLYGGDITPGGADISQFLTSVLLCGHR